MNHDQMMKKGIFAGAVLGVLTAVVLGVSSSFGAQQNGVWMTDEAGANRYYGADGQMWTNAVTPDGQYVDRTGVCIPSAYKVEELSSIPADAKSLLVIEGHGNVARATFYVKEEVQNTPNSSSLNTSSSEGILVQRLAPGEEAKEDTPRFIMPSAARNTQTVSYAWKQIVDTGAYVGRSGIGKEVEGDEKTPRGLFTLDEAFGTKEDTGTFNVSYLKVHDGHYWVGDSNSPYYNQMVDIRQTGKVFDTEVSEHLSTIGGKAYHYCMAVGYNKEHTPYKGSAIFLHCTDGPGTSGCIAIPETDMIKVLETIQRPAYILIDDGEKISSY